MVPKLRKPVLLTGFWCAGKSTIGKELGKKLGVPYVDLDKWIENKTKMSLNQLFEREGMSYFREFERQALELQVVLRPYAVIALGGGTLLKDSNIQLTTQKSYLIHLEADLKEIFRRLKTSSSYQRIFQPKKMNAPEDLDPFFRARQEGYERAHWSIEVTDKSLKEVTDQIIDHLFQKNLLVWEEKTLWMAN